MSLNKFTDGSVEHAWMNINCNSLNSTTSYKLIDLSLGSVITNSGTGTLNISPVQLVNGVLGANGTATLTIQLPTAAQLNTYVGSAPSFAGDMSFRFDVYASGTLGPVSNVNIALGTGITTYNGVTTIPVTTGVHRTLVFAQDFLTSNWVIYF